jgi:ATP-dependent helicase HrpB
MNDRLVPLPIDPTLPEIVERVKGRGVVVLQAPPGAGKTTRVPAALLDAGIEGKVIVLEPRRLAARLAARRVAEERGEKVGGPIGYEVRFDRAAGASTRLEFVTEGILTRRFLANKELRGVGAVVLDEFHERHLQGDVALALLERLRRTSRPDLRLIVMSATLDAMSVASYLDASVVTSAGRQFEVQVSHAPEVDDRPLEAQVASALRDLLKNDVRGDILVFLPGAAEIRRAMERAAPIAAERDLLLVPLHGDLSLEAQDTALKPAGRQKVIFSTNVAETSVTIEGVEAVVDSGLARVAKHDPWSGRPSLDVAKISRASATQRAGRAGRLGPGRALRLFTKGDFDTRAEHDTPEILRADLADTLLALRVVDSSAEADPLGDLRWLDPPPRAAALAAEQLLVRLGAIDEKGRLTRAGSKMLDFALPPRLSKLLLEAATHGASRAGAIVAAMLAEGRDVYARSWDSSGESRAGADETSDLLARLRDVEEATFGRFDRRLAERIGLDPVTVSSVMKAADQLARACRSVGADREMSDEERDVVIRRAVLAAFPDRVAKRRQDAGSRLGASREIVLSSGGTAMLAETSVVRTAPWLVAVEAGDRAAHPSAREKRQTRVWMASAIEPDWLIDLYPGSVEEKVEVAWSSADERVVAVERLVYDRLALDERPAGPSADDAIAAMLAEKALAAGIGRLAGDAFDRLSERLAFVASAAPDLADKAGLAPLDPGRLAPMLVAGLAGKRSFAEIRASSLIDEIRAAIGPRPLARLDELAPEQVTLGGGRRVRVHYEPDKPPWIESRLQDFFGGAETPRVLAGRVPLVLHLLAPNGRDVQVTTDLAGFWSRTYPGVRNELMRRYPRHAWPADPLTASPPAPRHRGKPG